MSEKKSWDIQPNNRRATAPQSVPVRSAEPVRTTRPASPRAQSRQETKSSMPRSEQSQRAVPPRVSARDSRKQSRPAESQEVKRNKGKASTRDESLKGRRRRARQRTLIAALIVLVLIVGGGFASLWWTGIRIETIAVSGPDSDAMKTIAMNDLAGRNAFFIPRNSMFFVPKKQIRADILRQFPDISALTVSLISTNAISIVSIPRQAALTWCGDTYNSNTTETVSDASSTPDSPGMPPCYSADAQGVIFAVLPPGDTASTDSLRIYAPLAGMADASSPLGASIAQASYIPNALQFVKVIKSLGVPIETLVLRSDEADLYAQSGTRITYVLGHEEQTAQVAQAVFPSLNVNNGSLEYVDLRFAGKAYYKAVGADTSSTASST
jgi:hypothetical protein